MRAVGYRQLWTHIQGDNNLEDAVEQAVVATRRLAKRQLTWLRSWPDLIVVDAFAVDAAVQIDKRVRMWLADGA